MMFAFAVFVVSLVGIAALFGVKYLEANRDLVFWPNVRARFDIRAGRVKELLIAARADVTKLPPLTVVMGRHILQHAALRFASFARAAEHGARRLADLVSYKRRFEKRETRSEFLKKVSEHKNGGGLETFESNGQNS